MKTIFTTFVTIFLTFSLSAQDKIIVHTATTDNSSGRRTYIDHPDLNNHGNQLPLIFHVLNPGLVSGQYNEKVTGVDWDSGNNRWSIINEDGSDIIEGSKYFVYIVDDPETQVYKHTNTTNFPTVYVNPFGSTYTFCTNHWAGVDNDNTYALTSDTVGVGFRNEEGTSPAAPMNAQFNVLYDYSEGVTGFTHLAEPSNVEESWTLLDHPLLNDNPNASFLAIHNYRHYTTDPEYNSFLNSPLCAFYHVEAGRWGVYNERAFAFPEHWVLDILVAPNETMSTEDINNIAKYSVELYPNPAKDVVNIQTKQNVTSIEIYDVSGKKVMENTFQNSDEKKMNVTQLPKGLYIMKIYYEKGLLSTEKLIKK